MGVSFARYYDEDIKLVDVSMQHINKLIESESNQPTIAHHVYHRIYTRFLKIFDYKSNDSSFNKEFKNGFIMMASCSLCIESIAAFLTGENETPGGKSVDRFKRVFEYAEEKKNALKEFKDKPYYKHIRCGLLHQGETTGRFTITRKNGDPLVNENSQVNAYLFHKHLVKLLESYRDELKSCPWDGKLWDACRMKIQYIVANSEKS